MITYTYTAKQFESGRTIKAEVQAESAKAAAKLLQEQQLVPISIEAKGTGGGIFNKLTHRITTKDRVLFTRQLATLINAGLPLTQGLRAVRDQISNQALLDVINQIVTDIEGGSSLSKAFGRYPEVFNQVYISLVGAGEASGSLDKALARVADQQEKDAAVVSKIRSALVYPVIVLLVVAAVLIFMLTTVVPQIQQLYDDLGEQLPLLTAVLVGISGFLINFWWLSLGLLIGGGYAIYRYFQTAPGRSLGDRLKMKVPLFGTLFMKLYMARFCRTGGVLLGSGLQMLEMLRIVKNAVNNVHIETAMDKVMRNVKGGKALSDSLEKHPQAFLLLVPQMIRIGEASGTIDQMMERTASYYEDELDAAIKNLSTIIEPLLMVVLGVVVGLIVAAILLPVYGLIGTPNLGA